MTDLTPLKLLPLDLALERNNYGHSVRKRQNPSPKYPTPINHYLINITQTTSGLDVRRMWDYNIGPIGESEERLFHESKGPLGSPAYIGTGFRNMIWRFPCYVTIILNNPNFYFIYNNNVNDPSGDPLTFLAEDPITKIQYHQNHSFYNAVETQVYVLDRSGQRTREIRRGIRFENFIKKDANGNNIVKPDERRYKFNINIMEPVQGGHVPRYTDPDGTNQGPPGVP